MVGALRTRIEVRERFDRRGEKVLVQQQLHAATISSLQRDDLRIVHNAKVTNRPAM
jgi:hypothetical protein